MAGLGESGPRRAAAGGVVRPAELRDLDRVAGLWTAITEHHRALDALFRQRRGADAEAELRQLLRAFQRDPDAAIFVYERRAAEAGPLELCGVCMVRIDRAPPILEETERAEITDLGVRPEARRAGVGTRLLEAALAWVRAAGVERIEVQVAVGNEEGQAFWRRHGFGELMDVLHRRL